RNGDFQVSEGLHGFVRLLFVVGWGKFTWNRFWKRRQRDVAFERLVAVSKTEGDRLVRLERTESHPAVRGTVYLLARNGKQGIACCEADLCGGTIGIDVTDEDAIPLVVASGQHSQEGMAIRLELRHKL